MAEGFILGLSTGPYCLTACAPLLAPYLMADAPASWKTQIRALIEFVAGRLTAYVIFGLTAGFLGKNLSGPLSAKIIQSALIVSGLLMLLYFFKKASPHTSLCAALWRPAWAKRFPFVLGCLVGINICPPFVAGLSRVIDIGSAGMGMLYFLAFFAGTTLYLMPLLIVLPLSVIKRAQTIGTLMCGLAGLWFIAKGLLGFFSR